ncbi:MAG TPA: tetratricopeptide repeat-containing diguanylate cyclase [Ideonella sp.]|nr:tetratricopeptide repeat-containing diguanylate cyclase [Ideonella sp.]
MSPSSALPAPEQELPPAADPLQRAAALVAQAHPLRNREPERAAAMAAEAVALLEPLSGIQAELAAALSLQGMCLRNRGDYAAAARAGRCAVQLFSALAGAPDQAAPHSRALSNLGITLCLLGKQDEALQQFEQARSLSQGIGDAVGEADALMNTAIVANQMGDDARALRLGQQALPIYEALDDHYHLASVLNNMAYAQICWGNKLAALPASAAEAGAHFAAAEALLSRALPLAQQAGDPEFNVICMDTLGAALRAQGQWERARSHLQEQLRCAHALPGRRMEAVTLAVLGELALRCGELPAAIATLWQADALFGALGLAERHAATLLSLSQALEADGQPAEALAVFKRYHATELAHRSQAAEERLHVLEARLQLEHSEAELAQARERERTLAALNARLVEADQQRRVLLAELERHSFEDPLTCVANRRAFDQRLQQELKRAQRHGSPLSLALIDVDFFKQINDRHSHGVGDTVLRKVAQLLRTPLRQTDLLARFGGDEFAMLLPDTEPAGARTLCEKLCQTVAAHDWSALAPGLRVTLSIGTAPLRSSAEGLMQDADAALYGAKAGGRNQVSGPAISA